MNRTFRIFPILLFLSSISNAQNGPTLSVDDYLLQVQTRSPSYEGTKLLEEAATELKDESRHTFAPRFFTDYAYVYDKRPTVVPTFQGTKTTSHSASVGVKKDSDFGLSSSLYYNAYMSEVFGVNPAFYPDPKLYINSLNLQLSQSILRNGFGKSAKSLSLMKDAENLSTYYRQKFQRKTTLAEAENRYWQLSLARAFVAAHQNSLERTQTFHKINVKRARLNLIDSEDLLSIDAAIKQRELELKNALDQEKVYARLFNEQRGENSDQVPEQLVTPTPEMIAALPTFQKTELREDIKAAQSDVEAARQSSIYARDQRMPLFNVFSTLSTNGLDPVWDTSAADTFDTDHPMITVGAQLDIPLDFSKNKRVRKAYEKQALGAEKTYQQALIQQEAAWNELNQQWTNARERLDMAIELKKTQTTKLEKERARQQRGRSTTYQVFLYEQDLLDVEVLILQTEELAMNIYSRLRTYETKQ